MLATRSNNLSSPITVTPAPHPTVPPAAATATATATATTADVAEFPSCPPFLYSPTILSNTTCSTSCPKTVCSETVNVKIASKAPTSPLQSSPGVDCIRFRSPTFDTRSVSTESEDSPVVEEEHTWARHQNRFMTSPSHDSRMISASPSNVSSICVSSGCQPDTASTPSSSSSPFTPFSVNLVNSSPENAVEDGDEISPKVEEPEEVLLPDIKLEDDPTAEPDTLNIALIPGSTAPRKRGRPRKLPIPGANARVAKGRSKTGCITCRRRKKKCDETKPTCLNCQKNAVVCEGYPPKGIWKSGKQKATEAATRRQSVVSFPRTLPFLIDGIETEIDRRLLDHFANIFSRVLTMVNDDTNPFKEIMLPMATQNRSLMHSLMCLSGAHLSSKVPDSEIIQRKHWHFDHALSDLREAIQGTDLSAVDDSTIASAVALCLRTVVEGETNGEYRYHMNAARFLLDNKIPKNEAFRSFITEFLQYHEVSSRITTLNGPPAGAPRLPDFVPHRHAGAFLGIFDGLFLFISQITDLRERIRRRIAEGAEPPIDFSCTRESIVIDEAIRNWEPSQAPGTTDWTAAQLYRQSTWVYLYRTMKPSKFDPKIAAVVDDGLAYLRQLPKDSGPQSIMLMPLFLLGCAAFKPEQRAIIEAGFQVAEEYSGLGNIKHAKKIVERVWETMDSNIGDSWDWEKIIADMGYDFLVT